VCEVTRPFSILVVSPHPDDAESGMGRTMLVSRKRGHRDGYFGSLIGKPFAEPFHGNEALGVEDPSVFTV
jgi:hypothetical protein